MTKHDDSFYFEGIKEHVAAIKNYLPESKEAFIANELVQDAILMRLLAIGEELSHISDRFSDEHPELQWHKIIGLRNRIAHGYFEVDKDVIWEALTDGSLDELEKFVASY